jgi:hypothetical protein
MRATHFASAPAVEVAENGADGLAVFHADTGIIGQIGHGAGGLIC